jgi:hypothetical protein
LASSSIVFAGRTLELILGLLLLAVSLVLVAFTTINLRSCITRGVSSAYGRPFSRAEMPVAFWVSACCSALGLLMGAALALVAFTGLVTS